MRLLLPTVILPNDLTHLLKMNIPTNLSAEDHPAIKLINENKALYMILDRSLHDYKEEKIGLSKMFTAYGWSSFKDRWAYTYVYKTMYGYFPDDTDLDLIQDVKNIEERFKSLQAQGSSRIYLLAFYLKMINLEHKKINTEAEDDYWLIPEDLDDIIKSHAYKSEKADLLLLSLWQFCHFLGADKVVQIIKNDKPYEMLFAYLTEPQRYQFINNLLAYGASINDDEIFISKKV